MLRVVPDERPSAQSFLQNPIILKRTDETLFIEPDELDVSMLKTINFPSNILYLTEKLPVAHYEPIKTRISQKFAKSSINLENRRLSQNEHNRHGGQQKQED